MARTVSRGEARDRRGFVAVGAIMLGSILLIAFLASRQGPKGAQPRGFPPSQAVPVSAARLQRVAGAGTIGWLLPVPLAGPRDVAVAPAGTVWITEQNKGAVDAFLDGKLLRYEVDAKFPSSGAFALSAGPSDSMWFTGYPNGNIGRMLPDGTVNSFSAVADTSETVAAAQALDGSMWMTDVNLGVVVRIDAQGRVAAFAVPPPTSVQEQVGPYDIARAADGTMWFTDPRTRSLGTISAGGRDAHDPRVPRHRRLRPTEHRGRPGRVPLGDLPEGRHRQGGRPGRRPVPSPLPRRRPRSTTSPSPGMGPSG